MSLSASWEVFRHDRPRVEIYGTKGSMQLPDPNFFGGTPRYTNERSDWIDLPVEGYAFQIPNTLMEDGVNYADYRTVGVLDMAAAIRRGRPHRASAELALHVLEVLEAFETSSTVGQHVPITTTCERPSPIAKGHDEAVIWAD